MQEEDLTNSNTTSRGVLISALKTVRRTTRKKYLKIFLITSNPDGATMNAISIELAEKPQSIHRLLQAMIDREALTRTKQGVEFFYHLATNISKEDVEAELNAIAYENAIDVEPQLGLDNLETVEPSQPEEHQLEVSEDQPEVSQEMDTQKTSSESDRTSEEHAMNQAMEWKEKILRLRLAKLPALPEFNPNWSEEKQDKWFALYEKIIEQKDD